jgi:S-sulfosulfanyl-L-cysteine sulfohydrolase
MAREVGKTDTILMRYDVLETSADDFISDAVKTITGADIGITNGFRFGVPVASSITEGALWNILPMDARAKKGWVTGKELKDYWEDELEMVYSNSPMKLNGGWDHERQVWKSCSMLMRTIVIASLRSRLVIRR